MVSQGRLRREKCPVADSLTAGNDWNNIPTRSSRTISNTPTDANSRGKPTLTPLSGADYFESALSIRVGSQSTFRVYYTPPNVAGDSNGDDEDAEEQPVVFVCHHGAGYSGLSFALLAKQVHRSSNGKAGVLSLDCRGHGEWSSMRPVFCLIIQRFSLR